MRTFLVVALVLIGGFAAGQEAPTLAEGQWTLTGRVTTTACARGRCATRRQSLNQSFEVTSDGGTTDAFVIATCPGVSLDDAGTLVTFEPGRNGWFRARIVDRRALVRLLRDCTGYRSLRLQRLRARVRVAPGGESFELRESASVTVVVQGVSAQATVSARVFGSRAAALESTARSTDTVGGLLTRAIAAVAP